MCHHGAIGTAVLGFAVEALRSRREPSRERIMETAQDQRHTAPGTFAAFARFVVCGGGVGLASSFAVVALASSIPWALANAVITVASTLLATELHARFTFGAGGRATLRQHVQSAGSAAGAYAVTCVAMFVLQLLVAAPGAVLEQVVYLSASALVGVARFAVLRLVVFAQSRSLAAATLRTTRPVPATVARASAPVGTTALCHAA
jgi:putative flippase GtrA